MKLTSRLLRWGLNLYGLSGSRYQGSALTVPPPAEKYGKETREILMDMGYSPKGIDDMITTKAVSESWSAQSLPD